VGEFVGLIAPSNDRQNAGGLWIEVERCGVAGAWREIGQRLRNEIGQGLSPFVRGAR
jgi:hypothetical protein